MRITLRIDDDLMLEIRKRAAADNISLTALCNQVLRQGLKRKPDSRIPYRQRVISMGAPLVNLDKALALAAAEEDVETMRKLTMRK